MSAEQPASFVSESFEPDRLRRIRRWLQVLGVLGAGSLFGVAFSLYLVNHAPLLLIALSPLGRHLVLVAPSVDPTVFVAVAVLRRLAFYLACFELGRALGPPGILWIEARAGWLGRFVRFVEGWFGRAPRAVVLVMAGPTVSMLAGISGMRATTFAALATPSLLLRMLFVVGFAEWLRQPIEALLAWIDEIWFPGTALLATGVALAHWRRRRRGALAAPSSAAG